MTTLVRSLTLRLKDTSPFSEEGYFPEFTDYYYRASRERKNALDAYMRLTNYSSADGDVLRELYRLIYEQRLDGEQKVFVSGSRQVRDIEVGEDGVRLSVEELNTGESEQLEADFVVLATGFRDLGPAAHQERVPALMRGIADASPSTATVTCPSARTTRCSRWAPRCRRSSSTGCANPATGSVTPVRSACCPSGPRPSPRASGSSCCDGPAGIRRWR